MGADLLYTHSFLLMVNKQGQTRLAQYYEVRRLRAAGASPRVPP